MKMLSVPEEPKDRVVLLHTHMANSVRYALFGA